MHRRGTFFRDIIHHENLKNIVPCVCHHGWTQTFCQVSEYSEHRAEDCDEHHAASTFVTVTGAENDRRSDKSDDRIAAQRRELELQVATKDNFFHKTGSAT